MPSILLPQMLLDFWRLWQYVTLSFLSKGYSSMAICQFFFFCWLDARNSDVLSYLTITTLYFAKSSQLIYINDNVLQFFFLIGHCTFEYVPIIAVKIAWWHCYNRVDFSNYDGVPVCNRRNKKYDAIINKWGESALLFLAFQSCFAKKTASFWVLSFLHDVIVPETNNYSPSGTVSYKAQSQDEEALVRAAASLHMVFVNKNSNILGMNLSLSL